MSLQGKHLFEFDQFRLDIAENLLLREGEAISVTPKVFETLQVLVENAGHLVEKDELMQRIWPDRFVEESNLSFNIKMLRRALGDDAANPRFIETVPRRGYRFIAPVHQRQDERASNAVNGAAAIVETVTSRETVGLNGHPVLSNNGPTVKGSNAGHAAPVRRFSRIDRLLVIGFVVSVVGVALSLTLLKSPPRTLASRLTGLHAERLSDTGNATAAAISPDGKLITYSTREGGKPVIWIRQLLTGRSLQIVPPSDQTIAGLSFSPDGEYVDCLQVQGMGFMDATRVSILGGTPTKFLSNVHSGFTFSPDDTRVAFGRMENGISSLMVSNADGSEEKVLFSAPKGTGITNLAWSPDGRSIAFGSGKYPSRGSDFAVREFDLEEGIERDLTQFKWNQIEGLMWLPDKSGILLSGTAPGGGVAQIWLVTLPGGETKQISSSTAALDLRAATADFSKLLGVESSLNTRISVGDLADPSSMKDVAQGKYEVALAGNGTIVFQAMDTMATDLWISTAEGPQRKQLTADKTEEARPNVSPDGRFIAYVVKQEGRHNIWRMGLDGSNPVRLTNGAGEDYPTFTPDSRFVVYNSLADGSLMKVPVDGGEAKVIFKDRALRAAMSPDGANFAYIAVKEKVRTLFVRRLADGTLLKEFEVPGVQIYAPKVAWKADGSAVLFAVTDENNVANIFQQRLDGKPPEKLTDFTSDRIFDFSVSPKDNRIALVRGDWKDDAVLLSPILD